MRRLGLALLAATALAGCAANTGVETTPTFAAARYVPPTAAATPRGPAPAPSSVPRASGPAVGGMHAVAMANRYATIEPDSRSMRGATWYIERVDQGAIYRVPITVKRTSTILLPEGEKFSSVIGGDVDAFLINVAYVGLRPAVSVLPRHALAKGNLQLMTTGGFYSFDLQVNPNVAVNVVDLQRGAPSASAQAVANAMPQPLGDFTRLAVTNPDGKAMPAWRPGEAWADSHKMVVRFDAPLPVLPALFAGMRGEQIISYRSVNDPQTGSIYLVTSRRVTEAELRVGQERLRITVDPAAVQAGTAAEPGQAWRNAEPLASAPGQATPNVAVMVVPGNTGTQPVGVGVLPPGAFGTPVDLSPPPPPPAAPPPARAAKPDLVRL